LKSPRFWETPNQTQPGPLLAHPEGGGGKMRDPGSEVALLPQRVKKYGIKRRNTVAIISASSVVSSLVQKQRASFEILFTKSRDRVDQLLFFCLL